MRERQLVHELDDVRHVRQLAARGGRNRGDRRNRDDEPNWADGSHRHEFAEALEAQGALGRLRSPGHA
jgi:hypothetical protein